jgi:hypothetical protein
MRLNWKSTFSDSLREQATMSTGVTFEKVTETQVVKKWSTLYDP